MVALGRLSAARSEEAAGADANVARRTIAHRGGGLKSA